MLPGQAMNMLQVACDTSVCGDFGGLGVDEGRESRASRPGVFFFGGGLLFMGWELWQFRNLAS